MSCDGILLRIVGLRSIRPNQASPCLSNSRYADMKIQVVSKEVTAQLEKAKPSVLFFN